VLLWRADVQQAPCRPKLTKIGFLQCAKRGDQFACFERASKCWPRINDPANLPEPIQYQTWARSATADSNQFVQTKRHRKLASDSLEHSSPAPLPLNVSTRTRRPCSFAIQNAAPNGDHFGSKSAIQTLASPRPSSKAPVRPRLRPSQAVEVKHDAPGSPCSSNWRTLVLRTTPPKAKFSVYKS